MLYSGYSSGYSLLLSQVQYITLLSPQHLVNRTIHLSIYSHFLPLPRTLSLSTDFRLYVVFDPHIHNFSIQRNLIHPSSMYTVPFTVLYKLNVPFFLSLLTNRKQKKRSLCFALITLCFPILVRVTR